MDAESLTAKLGEREAARYSVPAVQQRREEVSERIGRSPERLADDERAGIPHHWNPLPVQAPLEGVEPPTHGLGNHCSVL